MDNSFYIYCLFRPWNLEPCYIGKGSGNRSNVHAWYGENHYNPHLANVYRRAGSSEVPCVILHDGLDEQTAFAYERAFIQALGRSDLGMGPLCNLTDGGEGHSGVITSEALREARRTTSKAQYLRDLERGYRPCNSLESIAKRAASNRGMKRSAEFKDKQRRNGRAQYERDLKSGGASFHSPESQVKAAGSRIGNKNAAGKPQSVESNLKRSKSQLGVRKSPEAVVNMIKARRLRALRESGAMKHG